MKEFVATPNKTKEIINKYSFVFQKKFGQNFLIDTHVINKIIRSAEITKDDVVVEIGPGIGSLTQHLAEHAGQVLCIEIDKALIPILETDTLKDYDNVRIINQDVLKVDLKKIIDEDYNGKKIKVVANLPYYITTPIIMGLFEGGVPLDRIIVMIQKEVADRMQANPGTKDYGALSLAVQYYSEPEIVANVPPNCFIPRPKVSSAVIQLRKREDYGIKVTDEKFMFQIIRASFNQRRKTLVNGIKNSSLNIEKEKFLEVLKALDIKENIRGEALSLEQFAAIANTLKG
ncbi:16S rRNA (adenine(1518)-N(6)/adenine(1519)-N(6))-dimethyltransferase RsmA [Vallitalea okinawensis]|uniref:16S rRNA (adenine(1518)-N(6)/adenine(1519)-N(6))- dimethyltransferase RsmA n=1 Tax=Vallitalea okinawensis TaxID=2078660 RepID=UPI000CFABCE4|nr:16S rRNA (adenine(1518)-N(6)/adenine(1519)-N(6))-dimethyltransferase RsmA [Vallitalea okinawensis]